MILVPDSRIAVPPLPPRCIPRPRLVDALTRATEQPLTLVAAAAGSGKTVLLTEWAASRPVAPAWVSLGASDNEPSRFWSLVAAAFRLAGLGPAPVGELDVPSVAIDEHMRLIDPYLSAAAAGNTAVFLVVDDAHVLTHPTILYGIDALLRAGGSHVHLVLAARTDPLLPLHRYRLAGQMSELRARDLAMTSHEAQALLLAHHVTLSPREFNVLAARTEGWTAGLRLSAMSMEGAERPEEFVSEFALDQGSVGEYLMHEVLGRQPDRVRTLLVETSFLPDISAGLAEAVTGFRDAGEMLAGLSRTNAFVVPLDRASGRFRYHQLFREMLRYLLHREPESHREDLFQRASRWYYQQGEYGAALRVAVDARDWPRAAAMLVHGGYTQAFINHTDLRFLRPTDLRDLASIDSTASSDTGYELALARSALYAAANSPDAARLELDAAKAAYSGPLGCDVALTSTLVKLAIAQAEHRIGDLAPLAAAVMEAARLGDESVVALTAAVELTCGAAHFWMGHYDTTEQLLLEALVDAGRAEDVPLELRCVAQLALFHAYWGRFRTSEADEDRARALMRAHPDLMAPTALSLALGLRAFYQADFDAAFASLCDAEAAVGAELTADVQAAVPMLRGLLLASVGQVGSAQVALASRTEVVGTVLEDFRVTMLAAIETALGRPHAALKLLRELPGGPPSPGMALAGARAYLALGELREAEDCLRLLLAAADTFAPRSAIVEALVTQAQICEAGNDEERAVENLVRACELAAGEIVHPFVLVADDFRQLVARHSSLTALWPDIQLGVAPIDVRAEAAYPPSRRLPEPLTDRERTVLRWLSTTMSTKEIAEEMCLSINTVKTHIAAIYRKLAAARRRDAVLRARALELL